MALPSGDTFVKTGQISHINSGNLANSLNTSMPTLILFPLLIIMDVAWNFMHDCANPIAIGASIVLSGLVGIMWASIITSTKNANLQYISNSLGNVCSKPTATMFRCRTKNASGDSKIASIPKINSAADIVEVTEGQLTLPTLRANSKPTGQ